MKILFSILGFLCILLAVPVFLLSLLIGLPILIRGKEAYLNFILLATANSLKLFFVPLGFIYSFFRMSKAEFSKYLMDVAVSEDQTGGVYTAEFLDDTMTKDRSEHFGDPDKTISRLLGELQAKNNLSTLGKTIGFILDLIDPGHLSKSIEK